MNQKTPTARSAFCFVSRFATRSVSSQAARIKQTTIGFCDESPTLGRSGRMCAAPRSVSRSPGQRPQALCVPDRCGQGSRGRRGRRRGGTLLGPRDCPLGPGHRSRLVRSRSALPGDRQFDAGNWSLKRENRRSGLDPSGDVRFARFEAPMQPFARGVGKRRPTSLTSPRR